MPISDLDPAALARLTASDLASLALSADQEARRLRKAGDANGAAAHDLESIRLASLFQQR